MKENEIKKNGTEMLSDDSLSSVAGGYNGQVTASGTFASQTGTSLNLLVSWSAVTDGYGQKRPRRPTAFTRVRCRTRWS